MLMILDVWAARVTFVLLPDDLRTRVVRIQYLIEEDVLLQNGGWQL